MTIGMTKKKKIRFIVIKFFIIDLMDISTNGYNFYRIYNWFRNISGLMILAFFSQNPFLRRHVLLRSYLRQRCYCINVLFSWIINAIGSLRKDVLPFNYPLTEFILREGRKLKRFCTPDKVSLHMNFIWNLLNFHWIVQVILELLLQRVGHVDTFRKWLSKRF